MCIAKHFDTYFKLSLSDETVSSAVLQELITKSGDRAFIESCYGKREMSCEKTAGPWSRSYQPRDGRPRDPSTFLVTEDAIPTLKDRAIAVLRSAAEDGTLLRRPDLIYNVYRWIEFSDDNGVETRAWLNGLLTDDAALVVLAKNLTGESWSTGMGGLWRAWRSCVASARPSAD